MNNPEELNRILLSNSGEMLTINFGINSWEILLIFVIGLTPGLISLWFMRQAEAQTRERLRTARLASNYRRFLIQFHSPEGEYIENYGYVIGDISCRFNARSAYIRCAVNPSGPCKDCSYYEPTDINC